MPKKAPAKKNKGWRPRKIKNPKELWDKFIAYCVKQSENWLPIYKRGFLAEMLLGHWYFYDLPEKFSDTLKKIDFICQAYAEWQLFQWKNVAGVIFNLCNNYKDTWKNKQHQEITGKDESPLFDSINIKIER